MYDLGEEGVRSRIIYVSNINLKNPSRSYCKLSMGSYSVEVNEMSPVLVLESNLKMGNRLVLDVHRFRTKTLKENPVRRNRKRIL